MIAYIIIIVVVAVLLVGVGSTMFLRPRGMHGVRRSRNGQLDMTGSMPAVKDADSDTESGGSNASSPSGRVKSILPPFCEFKRALAAASSLRCKIQGSRMITTACA